MRKISKLARSARSHIHRFPSMLVFCRYTVVYSAIAKVIKGNCITCIYVCKCILRPENNMFLRRSLTRACKLMFLSVHLGLPPPRPIPKSWLRYWQSYTFRARFDVNLTFITHQNLFLVPTFPKSPHRPPLWCPILALRKSCSPYAPPPPMWGKKCIAQTCLTFRAKMRNSGKKCASPKRKWSRIWVGACAHTGADLAFFQGGGGVWPNDDAEHRPRAAKRRCPIFFLPIFFAILNPRKWCFPGIY